MNTIVIGAGIAGLSAAWQLLEQGTPNVIVLEREALAFSHSSARNAAIFRPLEADAPVVKTVARSAQLLSELPGGDDALRRCGLLLVARSQAALEVQRQVAEQCAVRHDALGAVQLYDKYPELEGGRAHHALWLPEAGVLDIHRVAEALRTRIGALGGSLQLNAEISQLRTDKDGHISGVQLRAGRRIDAQRVVIAAGAWASEVGQTCGAALPLVPYRRHLAFLTPTSPRIIPSSRPVVWDVETGVYFRPESGGILACPGDHEPTQPGVPTVQALQLEHLAEHLPGLCPLLQTYAVQRPWACLRTMSADRGLVIGADPRLRGLFWLAGLGGQGMSAGLGAGELLANVVVGAPMPAHGKAFSVTRLGLDFGGGMAAASGEERLNG